MAHAGPQETKPAGKNKGEANRSVERILQNNFPEKLAHKMGGTY